MSGAVSSGVEEMSPSSLDPLEGEIQDIHIHVTHHNFPHRREYIGICQIQLDLPCADKMKPSVVDHCTKANLEAATILHHAVDALLGVVMEAMQDGVTSTVECVPHLLSLALVLCHLRMLPAFVFVLNEEVVGTFDSLCNSNVLLQEAQPIIYYFGDVWIGHTDCRLGRRLPIWNCQELPKTNNNIEGWHRGFQQHITASHPSFCKFISIIKMEQFLNEVRIEQYISGQKPRQHKKYRTSMEMLRRIVSGWAQHENTLGFDCFHVQ
uniref:Uncharacterized protein n=1 Tax=Timema cristinae TaxID=61476 RepID=A0A7R9CR10_TIMCR|nr:unnamed protein product [Timema cristinae]